jgi:hypothetical protein
MEVIQRPAVHLRLRLVKHVEMIVTQAVAAYEVT